MLLSVVLPLDRHEILMKTRRTVVHMLSLYEVKSEGWLPAVEVRGEGLYTVCSR